MRKSTQKFIETALRCDDTCDNERIAPAIAIAKGLTGSRAIDDMDWVMSRKQVAERLNVCEKTVTELANRKEILRVRSRCRRRIIGFSAKSVGAFLSRSLV